MIGWYMLLKIKEEHLKISPLTKYSGDMRAVHDLFQVIESSRNGEKGKNILRMILHINMKLIPTTGFIENTIPYSYFVIFW